MSNKTAKWYDASRIHVRRGEADVDVSAADYTSYQALVTIEPQPGIALRGLALEFDLNKSTTGFADVATTQQLTFAVQRKVDGVNWRTDKASETTAIAGNNADGYSMRIYVGDVSPDEPVRVVAKFDVEPASDVELPYLATYRAPAVADFTDVVAA